MAFSIEERTLIELYSGPESPFLEKVMQNTERNFPVIENSELVEQPIDLLHKFSVLTDADSRKVDLTGIVGY